MEDRIQFWLNDLKLEDNPLLYADLEYWLSCVKRIKYVL